MTHKSHDLTVPDSYSITCATMNVRLIEFMSNIGDVFLILILVLVPIFLNTSLKYVSSKYVIHKIVTPVFVICVLFNRHGSSRHRCRSFSMLFLIFSTASFRIPCYYPWEVRENTEKSFRFPTRATVYYSYYGTNEAIRRKKRVKRF